MALKPEAAGAPARKRILLLTPRWPYPPMGGDRLRILKLAEQVARKHDITLLSLCQSEAEMALPVPDDAPFVTAHRVLLPRWRSWIQVALALPESTPLQVAYYRSASFRRKVDSLLPIHDMVWCHLARTAPYASGFRGPRWLEMTDAVSLTMERAASLRLPMDPRRWVYGLEARRMRRFEQAMPDDFQLVSLIASLDRDLVFKGPQAGSEHIVVAPNGVSTPVDAGLPAGDRPPNIALIGRMDSLANRDALWFFVEQIWPALRTRVPAAQLHVIGYVRPSDAKRLGRIGGVRVEGIVPRLETILSSCRVGVCPVRIGAGVQNKLLDYMAHGLAAVTTSIGHEGVEAQPGVEVALANSPSEWVAQLEHLLKDAAYASALGSAGRALVQRRYQWPAVLAPMLGHVDEVAAGQVT